MVCAAAKGTTQEISVGMDDWASENCAHTAASFLNREALGATFYSCYFLGKLITWDSLETDAPGNCTLLLPNGVH